MPRAALALVWLLATSVVGVVAFIGYELRLGPPAPTAPAEVALEKIPKSRHDANPWARWTVTEQLSAHHVLIVQVETRYLQEARAIARTIVDPILPKDNYAEILIYFHRPGRPDPLPPRRVQWTPRAGYVETVYAP
jgi:hypothetical protein